jgi:hypothetical protein
MHTTMIGAWNGVEEVQQGCPSRRGGTRLIRFEFPRWIPKAIQVCAQFGVQEQCAIRRTPKSHTESVLDILLCLEAKFHRVSNGTSLMPKFHQSQRESLKVVDVQNLLGCCANTFWAVGPTRGPCGPRVLFTCKNRYRGYCSVTLVAARGCGPI